MDFLMALRNTGDVVEACVASKLSAEQFQNKLKTDVGFKESVDTILLDHELSIDRRIAALGKAKVLDLLEHGSTVHRQKKRMVYDGEGELIRSEVQTESVHFPTPEWVIKYALGQRDKVEQALITLADEALIPREKVRHIMALLVESKRNVRAALGEAQQTNEQLSRQAITQAQAELLGISIEQLIGTQNE